MAKSKLKPPFIIILLLLIFIIGGWFVISKTASNKVEQELEQWLVANNLQENLTWESLEASSTGTAKLGQVNIYDQGQVLLATAEELTINHYTKSNDVTEVDLDVRKLVDVKGELFQTQLNSYFADANLEAPHSIDLSWKMSLNKKLQSAFFNPVIELPGFMRLGLQLTTDSPEIYQKFMALLTDLDGFEEHGVFNLIPHAGNVKLNQLDFDVKDLGGMAQLQESLKKSMILGGSTPEFDKQREALWENRLAGSRMECYHDGSLAVVLQNHQQACDSLIDFMGSKKQAIQLKITATKAISLEEAMLAGMMGLSVEMLLAKYEAQVVIE
ncbi:hypothetical protein OURE66S_03905 [Oligella ureolytica]